MSKFSSPFMAKSPLNNGDPDTYKVGEWLDQDKIIIPIGSTGSAAKKIWDEENENSNFSKYNEEIKDAFYILNNKDKSINEIIDATINIIKQLTP